MTARADLHVHSKHSNRPAEWFLRTLRAPESFTEPLDIYRTCRGRGLDFVTITDHDTIDGALEIAHLPGTFVSCEVTAEFPEDRCEVHVLVFGIDERQHREIQELRGNLSASRPLPASTSGGSFRLAGGCIRACSASPRTGSPPTVRARAPTSWTGLPSVSCQMARRIGA